MDTVKDDGMKVCGDCGGLGRWSFALGGDDCVQCSGTGKVKKRPAPTPKERDPVDTVKSCRTCVRAGMQHMARECHNCAGSVDKPNWMPEERDLPPMTCETCALGGPGLACRSFYTCADGDMWQPKPQTGQSPVKSDGGSSSYYAIPEGAKDLQDLIEGKEMSFARGNLFKALYRLGAKSGINHEYDLNKCQWFLDRLKKMHADGRRL